MTTPRLRSISLVATLATTLVATGIAPQVQAEPRFGVCRQELVDYVEQRLGQTITHIEIQSYAEHTPPQSIFDAGSALVYVKECTGFQGFEIRATEDTCEFIPHYGSASSRSYIFYEGGFEGCRSR